MHGPFDPEVLKGWLIILLWFAALCFLVGGPVLLYLCLVWRGRRRRRELNDGEECLNAPSNNGMHQTADTQDFM